MRTMQEVHELCPAHALPHPHELMLNDNVLVFNYMPAVHRMVFVIKIEPEVRFPSPEMYRMLSVYFRECDAELQQGSLFDTPEEGDALLRLVYTYARHKYRMKIDVHTKPTQYADAPPNPPIIPNNTYGTVIKIEGIAEVYFEPKPYINASFNINYMNIYVHHAFIEIEVTMERLAKWKGTRYPKPNPASVVV